MPNPSPTQVVEFREEIALPMTRAEEPVTVYGQLALFSGRRGNPVGRDLTWIQTTVLDGLLGMLDHRGRGRCPFPSELPGTCMFDLRLPINGS